MSAATISPAPVRKSLVVKAPPDRAFAVFTAGIGRWWPASHTIGTSPQKSVVMEGRIDGRWYETGEDGSESEWGKVLAWDPPRRLVLAWQIGANFKYDRDLVTEVELRFEAEGEGTRVFLEHRNLDRMGAAAEAMRGRFEAGWGLVTERFAAEANKG